MQCVNENVNHAKDAACDNVLEKIEVKEKISIRFDLSDLNGFNELTEVTAAHGHHTAYAWQYPI